MQVFGIIVRNSIPFIWEPQKSPRPSGWQWPADHPSPKAPEGRPNQCFWECTCREVSFRTARLGDAPHDETARGRGWRPSSWRRRPTPTGQVAAVRSLGGKEYWYLRKIQRSWLEDPTAGRCAGRPAPKAASDPWDAPQATRRRRDRADVDPAHSPPAPRRRTAQRPGTATALLDRCCVCARRPAPPRRSRQRIPTRARAAPTALDDVDVEERRAEQRARGAGAASSGRSPGVADGGTAAAAAHADRQLEQRLRLRRSARARRAFAPGAARLCLRGGPPVRLRRR